MNEMSNRIRRARSGRLVGPVTALAVALLLAACGGDSGDETETSSGSGGEQYNWSLAETHAEDYPTTQADIWFADQLRERSDGRINIDVFPSAQLGEERDVLEQVQLGAVEMTRTSAGPVAEFVSEWGVFALPYLFDDDEHLWNFLSSDYGDQMLEGLRDGGYMGLAYFASGARNFYTVDGPIRTPDDLAGLNIRVQPGTIPADMIEAMGGSPVTMDFGEVYGALETGVIDGAENNEPSYVSTGHYEIAPHFTLDGHQRVPEVLLISATVWDSLSDEDQALIRQVAEEAVEKQRKLWDAEVEEAIATVEAAGNEVVEVDVEPFQAAVADMVDGYRDEFADAMDAIENAR